MVDLSSAKNAVEALIPPDGRPRNARARYDWAVSLTLIGVIAVGSFHIAQACGFMMWMGLGGFAMAHDVSEQQLTLNSIQSGQIMHDIRDAKLRICQAQKSRNQPALDSWSRQLESSRGAYFAITHTWPEVQSCEELLVTAAGATDSNSP